ncbi:MAG: gamma-glutamyltransferase family protein [Bacteroidota bacterium]
MKNLTILFFLSFLAACTIQYPIMQQTDASTKGMVSAAQPLATLAGQQMLEKGGNAVDAAVASAFALSVVEPSMSGLGGRLQAIVRLPNGEIHGVDATTEAPIKYDTATTPIVKFGYEVIGIPGVVAGLCKLLEEHGTLSLETVMQPAIKYAQKGFPILKGEAARHRMAKEQLTKFAGSRQYFMKDGRTYEEGEKLVQKDLANTLRLIAKGGRDAFYKGAIAEKIVADFQENKGILTLEDLANYGARSSRILSGSYRGHDLHGLWVPSFGALTIQILQILENLPVSELKDADWASAVSQAINIAYQDRYQQMLPNTDSIVQVLTSKAYAKQQAMKINLNGASLGHLETEVFINEPVGWSSEMGHTTHLSTADKDGMMVALTQSLGPNMGSKVASPELGFLYAVTLGRYLGVYLPGQRAASFISPFIITKNGEPFMALGAAGGNKIVSAVTAVSSRVIDHQLPLDQALMAPRVYRNGAEMLVETHKGTGWKQTFTKELQKEGFEVKVIDQPARFGRVHAVLFDEKTGRWIGGADPDWEGAVAGEKQ